MPARAADRREDLGRLPEREALGGRSRSTPRGREGPRPPPRMGRAHADRSGAEAPQGDPLQPDQREGARSARGGGEGGGLSCAPLGGAMSIRERIDGVSVDTKANVY